MSKTQTQVLRHSFTALILGTSLVLTGCNLFKKSSASSSGSSSSSSSNNSNAGSSSSGGASSSGGQSFTGPTSLQSALTLYVPTGLVLDSSNNLYVVDNANKIFKISSAGAVSTFADLSSVSPDSSTNDSTLAIDSSNIYVGIISGSGSNSGWDEIWSIKLSDGTGTKIVSTGPNSTWGGTPTQVTGSLVANGKLYFMEGTEGQLFEVPTSGGSSSAAKQGGRYNSSGALSGSIVTDASNNIYNFGGQSLAKFEYSNKDDAGYYNSGRPRHWIDTDLPNDLIGLSALHSSTLYYTDFIHQKIGSIDIGSLADPGTSGSAGSFTSTQINMPNSGTPAGIAVTSDGTTLFVVDLHNNQILYGSLSGGLAAMTLHVLQQ